jgi:membrane-bound lytic murein transglycosylase MltF
MTARITLALAFLASAVAASTCRAPAPPTQRSEQASIEVATVEPSIEPVPLQDLQAAELLRLNTRLTGDYRDMQERRFIRALVPYSRTFYFLDGAKQRGLASDVLAEFEQFLAARTPKGVFAPKIVIIPTSRDRMFPALAEGYGDVAVGGFTITEARREQVDFSEATQNSIRDVVVTSQSSAPIAHVEDLSGREVHVRKSSSYYEDLVNLNQRLAALHRPPVRIRPVDELLEDEDVLQMVDADIVPITVVKDITARLWAELYDQIAVREDRTLRADGQMAMAVRKNAPDFLSIVNEFVRTHRAGTLFGNVMRQRYFGNSDRLKNATGEHDLQKFRTLVGYFQNSASEFDLDWLLLGAQAYKESQLDQDRRSAAGAVGIMQIKPETAADKNVDIPDVFSVEDNIRAGSKYLRFMIDRYYADSPMDRLNRGLFALASYNAGPAKVARLRSKAEQLGLDPNVWFRNVEFVAAREIGRETVDYVGNIYKYYTAYSAIVERRATRDAAAAPVTSR